MDASADPHLQRPVQDADVVQAYRFFFGRDPESADAVAARRGATRRELLRELAGSGEYEERLARPVLDGRIPAGDQFSNAPARATLAWASSFLPLEDEARARLSRAPNWVSAHGAVLGDARMRAAVPELQERLPLDTLVGKLGALTADMGRRAVVGEVEEATAQVVRGYVVDRNAPDDVLGVELWVDDRFVAAVRADAYGRDLQERFGGSGRHGFVFEGFTPPDADEECTLRVQVLESGAKLILGSRDVRWRPAQAGHDLAALAEALREAKASLAGIEQALKLASGSLGLTPDRWDAYWRAYYPRTPAQVLREAQEAEAFDWRPRFDVLVTGGPRDRIGLEATLASVEAQVYAAHRTEVLLGRLDEAPPEPGLDGDYAVLLNAGDALAPDALHRLAAALQATPHPVLATLDSDTVEAGRHRDPVLRPAFDYDLLLQSPAFGPTAAASYDALRDALAQGGSLAPEDRSDLWLRVVEAARPERIVHVPRVLHHAGPAAAPLPPGRHALAVRDHLSRTGAAAVVRDEVAGMAGLAAPPVRIAWPVTSSPRVAVIVPTRDRLDLLGPCLASLEASSASNAARIEVVVVDNNSEQAATRRTLDALELSGRVRVLGFSGAFNWSAINNFAAREVEAEVLVFLNNDTVALTPDWCDALCGQALREEVGAVGARLLYEDGSIQHAGIVLGTAQALAAHEGAGAPAAKGGYLGRRGMAHRTAAVTGACLATRRDVFMRLGGFDEAQLAIEANDIDYCLRVRHAGLAVVYEPAATLYHFESRSRGHTGFDAEKRRKADEELAVLKARWGEAANRDPFYNPHFDRMSRPFTRLGPPPEF